MKTGNRLQLLLSFLLAACGTISVEFPTGIPSLATETFTPVSNLPDLLISAVSLTMQGNTGGNCVSSYAPYEIHVVIQNQGMAPAHNISIVETSTGTDFTVVELVPFGISELYLPAASPTGSYNFAVDPQNLITEIDESNNVYSFLQPTPTPPVLCSPTPPPLDGTPVAFLTPSLSGDDVPQATPLVVWQRSAPDCQVISFWSDRMGIGPCSPSQDPIEIAYPISEDYFSRYSIWMKAYAPANFQTALGPVTFNGGGSVHATPTELRMIAEWSARMLAALPEGNSSSGGSYVISKQYSDETSCFSMVIHSDGHYRVESCLQGYAYPAPTGYLDAIELVYFYRWYDWLSLFQESNANGTLSFIGNGPTTATLADKISIDRMAVNLAAKARGSVSGGGLPPGALAAQQLVSVQLGIPQHEVQVRSIESIDYQDTCLGAPKTNEACMPMLIPGLQIQLGAQGKLYEFHSDFGGYDLRQVDDPVQTPSGIG